VSAKSELNGSPSPGPMSLRDIGIAASDGTGRHGRRARDDEGLGHVPLGPLSIRWQRSRPGSRRATTFACVLVEGPWHSPLLPGRRQGALIGVSNIDGARRAMTLGAAIAVHGRAKHGDWPFVAPSRTTLDCSRSSLKIAARLNFQVIVERVV
jgi:hypothetical protein